MPGVPSVLHNLDQPEFPVVSAKPYRLTHPKTPHAKSRSNSNAWGGESPARCGLSLIAARYDVRSMANPARYSCTFRAACCVLHVSCRVLRDLPRSMANSARDRYTSRRLRLEYWQANMSKRRNAAGEEESAEPTFPIPDGFVFDESSNLCINVGTGAPLQRKATRMRR